MKCPSCGANTLQGEETCDRCLHSLAERDLPAPKKGDKIQNILLTAPIKDVIVSDDLLVAKPTDSIQKIVDIFKQYDKDCVVVYQKKRLVGILSQRDILQRVAGKHKDLSKVTVESVMTSNPEFVKVEDPIAFVLNKMAVGSFRHVPVLADDNSPITIISIRDVLGYLDRRD